jgi:hypothetical protein
MIKVLREKKEKYSNNHGLLRGRKRKDRRESGKNYTPLRTKEVMVMFL